MKEPRDEAEGKSKRRAATGQTWCQSEEVSSDAYPLINDWLEFTIIAVAMVGVIGGAIALVHLGQQVQ